MSIFSKLFPDPNEKIIKKMSPIIKQINELEPEFEKLSADKFFTHPVFGDVRIKQARRVIAIHTQHHIKIINDILSS